jgi:hypothetical protein
VSIPDDAARPELPERVDGGTDDPGGMPDGIWGPKTNAAAAQLLAGLAR